MNRFRIAIKTIRQLGLRQVGLYASYRLQKPLLRFATPPKGSWPLVHLPFAIPSAAELQAVLGEEEAVLHQEALAVQSGAFRFFGAAFKPFHWSHAEPLQSWLHHEKSQYAGEDIKFTWEPARFGWVYPLGRAYALDGDSQNAVVFQRQFEAFLQHNPPFLGPNWASAQEVGLRLLALVWAARVFAPALSADPAFENTLSAAVANHAWRVSLTLAYARAQDNNHLLVEAAALFTAGLCVPSHPHAARWCRLGWQTYHQALLRQIAPDGVYMQQSANYARVMLQTALWMSCLGEAAGQPFPSRSTERLSAAVNWLRGLVDPLSGHTPNLGANDGAYILPLANGSFRDHRPVLQSAALAFCGGRAFAPGPWDEMSLWFGLGASAAPLLPTSAHPDVLRHPVSPHAGRGAWVYLRTARFKHHRPGHADLLHLDLWYQGVNLASDPGTYLYNADPPWDNPLAAALAHNTITLDGQDQMTRAGRFLYLDWAAAWHQPAGAASLLAEHNAYHRLGVRCLRRVEAVPEGWRVEDTLLPLHPNARPQPHTARLDWLLPDVPWRLAGQSLSLDCSFGPVALEIQATAGQRSLPVSLTLYRAGERLAGAGPENPLAGWISPTYALRVPALSLVCELHDALPLTLFTHWRLPEPV